MRLDGGEDFGVGVGLEVLEGEVFELAADFAHPEAVRDGRVDLDGLAGDALAALGADVAERPHVVQAVGELDHDDADVFDHGEEHLAEAFGLALFGAEDVELGELGEAIDAARDLVAELLADLLDGDAGVLDDVVEKAGLDGGRGPSACRRECGPP